MYKLCSRLSNSGSEDHLQNCHTFRTLIFWGATAQYGNCYSFNLGPLLLGVQEASTSVEKAGPGNGLSLVLNIEQEHYGGITEAEGARWVLKDSKSCLDALTLTPSSILK